MIHKYRDDDAYPAWTSPGGAVHQWQSEDRRIRVTGTIRGSDGKPAAGKTVWFRVKDPADTAPYVVGAGDAHSGDNADGAGTLTAAQATSDADGRVSTTLVVTGYAAGDNYRIEASTVADGCETGTKCARSGTYTAWKRVYVEYNKMFRRGAYITRAVAPGAKEIYVSNVNPFPEEPFQVRLIHAPPVNGTAQTPNFYSEILTIERVTRGNGFPFGVRPGVLHLDSDPGTPGVQHAYSRGEAVGEIGEPRDYLADGVGLMTGNRADDYFLLDTRLVKKTFEEAFVEHVWLTDAIPAVDFDLAADLARIAHDGVLPYDPRLNASDPYQKEWLARKWIRHAQRLGQDRVSDPDHFVLFTATNYPDAHGVTTVGSEFNDLWLFVRQIGNSTQVAESLVHELGHQWRVNQVKHPGTSGAGDPGGHCDMAFGTDQRMYDRNLKCTMDGGMYGDAQDPERRDGVVGFHYARVGQVVDSEYLRIRRRQEPVPQNEHQRPEPK